MELSGKDGAWSRMPDTRRPLENWSQKAVYALFIFRAGYVATVSGTNARTRRRGHAAEVVDLPPAWERMGLSVGPPPGSWRVLPRYVAYSRVSTSSDGWQGYALDVLDADAFQRYWDADGRTVDYDAGPLAGHTLKYLSRTVGRSKPLIGRRRSARNFGRGAVTIRCHTSR